MELVDTKYIDVVVEGKAVKVKFEAGPVTGELKLPLVELLKQLATKTDNKVDDKLVEMLDAALGV